MIPGEIVSDGNGDYTFTPAADFNGSVSLNYTVFDPEGSYVNVDRTIRVFAVNDAPALIDSNVQLYTFSTYKNTQVLIPYADLLEGITDSDGDNLTISQITSPKGTITYDDATYTYTFTPDTDFYGTTTIDYIIDDGNGGLLPISRGSQVVINSNNAPVADFDQEQTTTEGNSAITGMLTSTDADTGDTATYSLISKT